MMRRFLSPLFALLLSALPLEAAVQTAGSPFNAMQLTLGNYTNTEANGLIASLRIDTVTNGEPFAIRNAGVLYFHSVIQGTTGGSPVNGVGWLNGTYLAFEQDEFNQGMVCYLSQPSLGGFNLSAYNKTNAVTQNALNLNSSGAVYLNPSNAQPVYATAPIQASGAVYQWTNYPSALRLFTQQTGAQNSGTLETTVWTNTLPAGIINGNPWTRVTINFYGLTGNDVNSKNIRFYLGNTYVCGIVVSTENDGFNATATIFRRNSSTASMGTLSYVSKDSSSQTGYSGTVTENLANALGFGLTFQGGATGDLQVWYVDVTVN
jgi:hypothetical protein